MKMYMKYYPHIFTIKLFHKKKTIAHLLYDKWWVRDSCGKSKARDKKVHASG
jgi:hypothetical protein